MSRSKHLQACIAGAEWLAEFAAELQRITNIEDEKAIEVATHFVQSLNERDRIGKDASFQKFLSTVNPATPFRSQTGGVA